jgi:hypothetical protein
VKLDLRSPKEMPGHLRSIGSFGRCIVNVSHCTCSDLFHNHGLTQHHRLSGSIWRMLCIYIYVCVCACPWQMNLERQIDLLIRADHAQKIMLPSGEHVKKKTNTFLLALYFAISLCCCFGHLLSSLYLYCVFSGCR